MTNQNQPERKPLNVLCSVDDIHPEIGYGLLKNNDQFRFLKKLHDEFGLKFTLFMVPVWKGNKEMDIRKHKTWIDWINSQGYYEIAAHGLFHAGARPELGAMELINIPEQEVFERIKKSKEIFEEVDIDVKGFKTPGWQHPNTVYKYLKDLNYTWIADHFIGEKQIKLSNGLIKIPYNANTEDLSTASPKNTVILHSHMSPKEGNKNGWTNELYQSTRNYLLELQKTREFKCMTMSEWVNNA